MRITKPTEQQDTERIEHMRASEQTISEIESYGLVAFPISGDSIATSDTAELERRAELAIYCSETMRLEAIGWTEDCMPWLEDEPSILEALSFIKRAYEGGIVAFYMASRVLEPINSTQYLGK